MLVIGTQARIYPAAGYIYVARIRGARVAVDMERRHEDELLKAVIGKTPEAKQGN